MGNTYTVPNGSTTRNINLGIYHTQTSVRHEKPQATQLKDIRAQEPLPTPAALMTKETYLRLGSGENSDEHRMQMAKTREKIEAALLGMDALEKPSQTSPAVDTSPQQGFSTLKRVVGASKRGFNRGVLSRPKDNVPNIPRAMQTPHSVTEREIKKTQGSRNEVLDEAKLNARIGLQHLANAQHLLQKAKQDHEVVTYRHLQRLEALQVPPGLIELVKERDALHLELLEQLTPRDQVIDNILHAAALDVENAEALVKRATTYTDKQSDAAKTLLHEDCQNIINALPGFPLNADPDAVQALSTRVHELFERLQAQDPPAKDALDGAQVFQLAYRAIVDTLSTVGGDADPARANALLEHLLAPADASEHYKTVIGMVMEDPNSDQLPATGKRPPAIKDMEAVLQALAPLRRGMEVIHRITAEDGHAPNL